VAHRFPAELALAHAIANESSLPLALVSERQRHLRLGGLELLSGSAAIDHLRHDGLTVAFTWKRSRKGNANCDTLSIFSTPGL
jgi:hypothetical protein